MTDINEVLQFQRDQQGTVIAIGAYISPLREFIANAEADISHADDINNIRRLQSLLGSKGFRESIHSFLQKYDLLPYYSEISPPYSQFGTLLANQTIPRKKLEANKFLSNIKTQFEIIADGMMAISHIPLPKLDVNIKASNAFQAYCFFTNMFASAKEMVYLVDPYLDSSLFVRYFNLVPSSVSIRIVSSADKWRASHRSQIEDVERLFLTEHTNYKRSDDPELHDRYVLTELACYQLGGSLKDAADKSDFSVVQLSESRRLELLATYFKD